MQNLSFVVQPGEFLMPPDARGRPPALSEDQARAVQLAHWIDKISAAKLSKRYGVSVQTIHNCVRFTTYPNLTGMAIDATKRPRAAESNNTAHGAPERAIKRAMQERDRSACWLDWPYSMAYANAPTLTIKSQPESKKRWCGPLVRVVWWRETGKWPGMLRMACGHRDCWNPWHAEDGRHRRLVEYIQPPRPAVSGQLDLLDLDDPRPDPDGDYR